MRWIIRFANRNQMSQTALGKFTPHDQVLEVGPGTGKEFDGLGRIVFSHRNKTVHATFMTKGVLEMLDKNWRTWCSLNNKVDLSDRNM